MKEGAVQNTDIYYINSAFDTEQIIQPKTTLGNLTFRL
jgi:hypothetical protein